MGIIIKIEAFYKYAVLGNSWLPYTPWAYDNVQIDSAHVRHIKCMWNIWYFMTINQITIKILIYFMSKRWFKSITHA